MDANTRAVFGDYIGSYDIQRTVADKATVLINYKSRIFKLSLNAAELPKLDAEFEEITEGEERAKVEVGMRKFSRLLFIFHDSAFTLPPWRISRNVWRRWRARR